MIERRRRLQQSKTARQIQKAAEALFAEQGFGETTMRQITHAASVNLAAVNYHFGSKQGLIQAVAEKYLTPFTGHLSDAVSTCQYVHADMTVSTEELLEMLMRALLHVHQSNGYALAIFSRLMDLSYAPGQEELRDFLIERYSESMQAFLELLRKDAAPMQDDEFFWRLHFLLGSMIFTLSNYHTLTHLDKRENDKSAQVERVLHRMIPVLTAGFLARSEGTFVSRI